MMSNTLIIAEAGVNHNGKLDIALKLLIIWMMRRLFYDIVFSLT